jgi:3-hydroxyacyl-[acyl-carrier-protein] dehydratase
MRWFWIDRFTEFVSGTRATAVKNVALSEEQMHDHFPGHPIMPAALIIEGMAQTGGLLVGEHNQFLERVVLAKLSKSVFHFAAMPGDTLVYRTVIEQIKKDGAMVTATSHVGDRLQAEAEIFFAHLDDRSAGRELFEPEGFLRLLTTLRVFEVGVRPDGTKIPIPPHLAKEEVITDRID